MSTPLEVRTHADAEQRMTEAGPDLAVMVRVLREYVDSCHVEARECAGDEPATFDEVENDGAAQAWGEVFGLLSFALSQAGELPPTPAPAAETSPRRCRACGTPSADCDARYEATVDTTGSLCCRACEVGDTWALHAPSGAEQ